MSEVINEVIETGKAERKLIDKAAKLWLRISRWTHATDIEFYDGKTAQEKLGNINGISTEFDDRDDIAASISSVNNVNEELQYRIGGFRIYRGEDGHIYIIDENAGADSVPKKLGDTDPIMFAAGTDDEYLFAEDTSHVYVYMTLQQDFRKGTGIQIKLPNSEYVGLKFKEPIWENEESGMYVELMKVAGVAANSSGSMFYILLYMLKNIPAGTMIKKKCMVFK